MSDNESIESSEADAVDPDSTDSESSRFDTVTVECYRRRDPILSGTYHAEWWMAIAVLLITAGFAFAIL